MNHNDLPRRATSTKSTSNPLTSAAYLTRCAENEGARAIRCITSNERADLAAYFAREAAHYAGLLVEQRELARMRRAQRARSVRASIAAAAR